MGILTGRIVELQSKINKILGMIDEIDTRKLQRELERFVFKCFSVFKPLSRKYREVCIYENDGYREKLCVGEWLRLKSGSQRYGSYVCREWEFFDVVRKCGDKVKPYVRRSIREDFSGLVDLVKKLKPFSAVRFSVRFPPVKVSSVSIYSNSLGFNSHMVSEVFLDTKYPHIVELRSNGKIMVEIRVNDVEYFFELEDVIDYVVELYLKVRDQVIAVKKHNDKVVEEMRKIVEPWMIANKLSN